MRTDVPISERWTEERVLQRHPFLRHGLAVAYIVIWQEIYMCPVNRENNEKCLYSQQVFSVSTIMTNKQIQTMYPVSHRTAKGVAVVRNRRVL